MKAEVKKISYKIWTKNEIKALSKSSQELINFFFQTLNIHKKFEYILLGLYSKDLNFKSLENYVNLLIKRKRIKDFKWLDYELQKKWDINNFNITGLFDTKLRVSYIKSLIKNENNSKCVVIVHGINSHRYKSFFYGLSFLRQGYNILVYDSRNHGHSEGKFNSQGWYEWQDLNIIMNNVDAVFKWSQINFMGWSMGAFTIMEYLKNYYNESKHKFAILDAPVDNLTHIWETLIVSKMHLSWFKYFNLFQQKCLQMYGYDPEWLNPGENLDKIENLPILFIANNNDTVIPIKWTVKTYENKIFFEKPKKISYLKNYSYGHCQAIYKEYSDYVSLIQTFIKNTKT